MSEGDWVVQWDYDRTIVSRAIENTKTSYDFTHNFAQKSYQSRSKSS
jgi:hypothetical protein